MLERFVLRIHIDRHSAVRLNDTTRLDGCDQIVFRCNGFSIKLLRVSRDNCDGLRNVGFVSLATEDDLLRNNLKVFAFEEIAKVKLSQAIEG